MDYAIPLGVFIALIGCFVGLAGWLSGRESKISKDGEWRGSVSTQLADIQTSVGGVNTRIEKLECTVTEQGKEIATVKASVASAHKRIDTITETV